jgi:hypothetical protein
VNKVFYILLFIPILYSCENKKENKKIKEECYNLKYLASTDKNLPEVDFDWNFFRNSKVETLKEYFIIKDTCETEFHFKTNIGDVQDIEIVSLFSRYGTCESGVILNQKEMYDINISNKGLIYLNFEDVVSMDSINSISSYFEKYYFDNYNKFYSILISVEEFKYNVILIEVVLLEIIKGYKSAVSRLSQKLYSKSICDLTISEYLDFKIKIPFKIETFSSQRDKYSIPPPAIIN